VIFIFPVNSTELAGWVKRFPIVHCGSWMAVEGRPQFDAFQFLAMSGERTKQLK
jgi:hypothetical protein